MKVLIVEDEDKLGSLMEKGLKAEGLEIERTDSGRDALERMLKGRFDAVLLDVMIHDLDGISVLRRARREGLRTPILLVTARDAREERIEGLDAGADDYIVKPFFLDELVARLHAVWRRSIGKGMDILTVGDLSANLMTRTVKRGTRDIPLPTREFNLLVFLMKAPGRVYNRMQVFENVWNYDFDPETNLVDVYIGRLRRKIDDGEPIKLIETVRGVGYKIRNVAAE